MTTEAEMAERQGRMLAGLAERAYAVACDLADQALAAETPEQKAQLARAFHEVSRSVRQTLALEMRLHREARRAEREAAEAERKDTERAVRERKSELAERLSLRWSEYEADDDDVDLDAEVDELIDRAAFEDGFTTDPIAAVVDRIEADLRRRLEVTPGAVGVPTALSVELARPRLAKLR